MKNKNLKLIKYLGIGMTATTAITCVGVGTSQAINCINNTSDQSSVQLNKKRETSIKINNQSTYAFTPTTPKVKEPIITYDNISNIEPPNSVPAKYIEKLITENRNEWWDSFPPLESLSDGRPNGLKQDTDFSYTIEGNFIKGEINISITLHTYYDMNGELVEHYSKNGNWIPNPQESSKHTEINVIIKGFKTFGGPTSFVENRGVTVKDVPELSSLSASDAKKNQDKIIKFIEKHINLFVNNPYAGKYQKDFLLTIGEANNETGSIKINISLTRYIDKDGFLVESAIMGKGEFVLSGFKTSDIGIQFIPNNTNIISVSGSSIANSLASSFIDGSKDDIDALKNFVVDRWFNFVNKELNLADFELRVFSPNDREGKLKISITLNLSNITKTKDFTLVDFPIVKEPTTPVSEASREVVVPNSQDTEISNYKEINAKRFIHSNISKFFLNAPIPPDLNESNIQIRNYNNSTGAKIGKITLEVKLNKYYGSNGILKEDENFNWVSFTLSGFKTITTQWRDYTFSWGQSSEQNIVADKEWIKTKIIDNKNAILVNLPENYDFNTNLIITTNPNYDTIGKVVVDVTLQNVTIENGANGTLTKTITITGFATTPVNSKLKITTIDPNTDKDLFKRIFPNDKGFAVDWKNNEATKANRLKDDIKGNLEQYLEGYELTKKQIIGVTNVNYNHDNSTEYAYQFDITFDKWFINNKEHTDSANTIKTITINLKQMPNDFSGVKTQLDEVFNTTNGQMTVDQIKETICNALNNNKAELPNAIFPDNGQGQFKPSDIVFEREPIINEGSITIPKFEIGTGDNKLTFKEITISKPISGTSNDSNLVVWIVVGVSCAILLLIIITIVAHLIKRSKAQKYYEKG